MFDHRVLTDHFVLEHLLQTLSDFLPARHRTDVVKHW